jgi:hypothetical protein
MLIRELMTRTVETTTPTTTHRRYAQDARPQNRRTTRW